MLEELYVEGKDGQMFLNFDALEAKTSKEFVRKVDFIVSDLKYEFIGCVEDEEQVTVYLQSNFGSNIKVCTYFFAGILAGDFYVDNVRAIDVRAIRLFAGGDFFDE